MVSFAEFLQMQSGHESSFPGVLQERKIPGVLQRHYRNDVETFLRSYIRKPFLRS